VPAFSRWTLLSCGAAAAVALSGCADVSGSSGPAPKAAATLAPAVATLVKTDVGEYFGTPDKGTSSKDIKATVARLKTMPGVQSADLTKDGRIDLQFLGGSTAPQRTAAVKQLAAIGRVDEGV
jgi:hypothetical protein